MDVATSGKRFVVDGVVFADVLTSGEGGGGQEHGEIKLSEQSSLIIGLGGPAFDFLETKLSVVKGYFHIIDVAVGNDVEDNRLELGLCHGFSFFRILIDGDSVPDHLALFEEAVVGVAVILVDK